MSHPPLVLSASSVNTYLRCGLQWYKAYVEGIKSPPSLKQARGIAVHKAVETNMSQKIDSRTDLPVADQLDAYSDSFEEVGVDGFDVNDPKEIGSIKDAGVKLVELHAKVVAPTIQPTQVERPVQFSLNGITFSGQIDLEDDMGRIRDTKTTGRKPVGESYILNMTGYSLAKRQLDGEEETDIVLDYLVATKTPYYLPLAQGGPVTDDQIARFAGIVEGAADGINKGVFQPNGLISNACTWCGYKLQCKAYDNRTILGDLDFGQ